MLNKDERLIHRTCWAVTTTCLLVPAVFFLLAGCAGTRFYADVSTTAYFEDNAAPEVTLQSPLASYALGVEYEGWYFEPISHTSGLLDNETGNGITGATVGKRWYFNLRGAERPTTGTDEYGWHDRRGCR